MSRSVAVDVELAGKSCQLLVSYAPGVRKLIENAKPHFTLPHGCGQIQAFNPDGSHTTLQRFLALYVYKMPFYQNEYVLHGSIGIPRRGQVYDFTKNSFRKA